MGLAEHLCASVALGWKRERLPTVEEANKWLAVTLHDRSLLLVIDNVDPERVDAKEIPIPGGRCRTLITSRSVADSNCAIE